MRTIPKEITKDLLERLYVQEKKSLREIGLLHNKSLRQVLRYLVKFGIKSRPFSTKGTVGWAKGIPKSKKTRAKLSKAHMGKVLSSEHRKKVIRTLQQGEKEENGNWKGGRTSREGYVYLRMARHPSVQSNGYIAEHRYVMEQKIGRLLTSFEHVHHLNGIKGDNRPENLELINAQTHNLITMLETRVKKLEAENEMLKKKLIS